jgi:hypothetical protein
VHTMSSPKDAFHDRIINLQRFITVSVYGNVSRSKHAPSRPSELQIEMGQGPDCNRHRQ